MGRWGRGVENVEATSFNVTMLCDRFQYHGTACVCYKRVLSLCEVAWPTVIPAPHRGDSGSPPSGQ